MRSNRNIISISLMLVILLICCGGVYLKANNIDNVEDLRKFVNKEKNEISGGNGGSDNDSPQDKDKIKPMPDQKDYNNYSDYHGAIGWYILDIANLHNASDEVYADNGMDPKDNVFNKKMEIGIGDTIYCPELVADITLESIEQYHNIKDLNLKKDDFMYPDEVDLLVDSKTQQLKEYKGKKPSFYWLKFTIDSKCKWDINKWNYCFWGYFFKDKGDYYELTEPENYESSDIMFLSTLEGATAYLSTHGNEGDYKLVQIKGGEKNTIYVGAFIDDAIPDNYYLLMSDGAVPNYFDFNQPFFKLKTEGVKVIN